MTTPLYPLFQKRTSDFADLLIQNQVTPWAFLNSGRPVKLKKFDGKEIHYRGLEFEGSPAVVFWGRYIEPFLEHHCLGEISAAVTMAKDREVDGALLLGEIRNILRSGCKRVYDRMADIDRNLRGMGFPDKVRRRPIDREFNVMTEFIDTHVNAELAMWKQRSAIESWISRNKTLLGVMATIAAILGALAAIAKAFLS